MVTTLITFGIILLVVLMMSIGVILGRKPISGGTCGGKPDLKTGCAGCEKYEKDGRSTGCPGRDTADAVQEG
jgi:hypothetical protein